MFQLKQTDTVYHIAIAPVDFFHLLFCKYIHVPLNSFH